MVLDILIVVAIIYGFIGLIHALKHILEEIYSDVNNYGSSKISSVLLLMFIGTLFYLVLWSARYIKIGGYKK